MNNKDSRIELIKEIEKEKTTDLTKEVNKLSQEGSTKNKLVTIGIILVILIFARMIFSYLTDTQTEDKELLKEAIVKPINSNEPNEVHDASVALLDKVSEAEELDREYTQEEICEEAKKLFGSPQLVKSIYKTNQLFVNEHKDINGKVYRLRHFYKDGDNSQIPTYLLYEEIDDEDAIIIESSSHKKGPKYTEIEQENGLMLHYSEAYEIVKDHDVFIQFDNGQVKEIQGKLNLSDSEEYFLNCSF